jgi:hypothetical protein
MVQTVVPKYYNYYSWIIPCKGEKGPSIAFRIHLNEENAEAELRDEPTMALPLNYSLIFNPSYAKCIKFNSCSNSL